MAQLILGDRMRKRQGTEVGFSFDVGTSHEHPVGQTLVRTTLFM